MGACSNNSNDKRREIKKKAEQNTGNLKDNNNTNGVVENNVQLETNNKKEINNINYYLICPDCLMRSPHIEKLYYNEELKDFLVKYTCICNDNTMHSKEISLMKILNNKEPINTCNIHIDNKLISYCKTCRRALCNICKEELHKGHNIDEDNLNKMISKEDADNMLKIVKEKEQNFNEEININEKKMENGIDIMIQKLNEEKLSYKNQMKNYKDNNQKTFDFLKNLYSRYINNIEVQNSENKNGSMVNHDNNINNDIMLTNHINNFAIANNNMPKLNSNIDEILNQYNDEQKELKLNYDYGFHNNNLFSVDTNKEIVGNNTSINNNNINISIKEDIIKNNNEKKEFKEFICVKTLTGHTEKIVSLVELSSGDLASGSYDNKIRIWNINNNKEEKIINESGKVFCILEFEKDKILAGTSENCINLWDLDSRNDTCVYSFVGHDLWINALVKCNDNYFASASNDAQIKIWDYYKLNCISTLKGHVDCVLSLILLRNKFLCSGSADLTIRIWDWENNNCLSILKGHEKWVKCILELNNGIILSGSDDKTIKLWKNDINIETLQGHTHSVRTFCQINDKYFASGSFDCTIKIWEINTWKCIQTLYGHESNIICVISLNINFYNSNNKLIASCSNDKNIKIWEES